MSASYAAAYSQDDCHYESSRRAGQGAGVSQPVAHPLNFFPPVQFYLLQFPLGLMDFQFHFFFLLQDGAADNFLLSFPGRG